MPKPLNIYIPDRIAVKTVDKRLMVVDGDYQSVWHISVYNHDTLRVVGTPHNKKTECDNVILTGFTFLHTEGGYASLINDENILFSLSSDELSHSIRKYGIKVKGAMRGKFTWCVKGGEVVLASVGSPLHQRASKNSKLRTSLSSKAKKLLSTKVLKPGYVYMTRGGKFFLYGGRTEEKLEYILAKGFKRTELKLNDAILKKFDAIDPREVFVAAKASEILSSFKPGGEEELASSHNFLACIGKYKPSE